MILDKLENAEKYFVLHPKFRTAFEYLHKNEIKTLASGTYELEGKSLYASFSNNKGKLISDAKLEAHRKYIDIQFLIEGEEQIGWKAYKECSQIDSSYNAEKDVEFFSDIPQTYFTLTPNSFAIFFPWDAHAPLISDRTVHKVVIKVKL